MEIVTERRWIVVISVRASSNYGHFVLDALGCLLCYHSFTYWILALCFIGLGDYHFYKRMITTRTIRAFLDNNNVCECAHCLDQKKEGVATAFHSFAFHPQMNSIMHSNYD